jgi:hypothetical protein
VQIRAEIDAIFEGSEDKPLTRAAREMAESLIRTEMHLMKQVAQETGQWRENVNLSQLTDAQLLETFRELSAVYQDGEDDP